MNLIIRGQDRPLGLYIAGLPGYGKSSLIQDLALKDIKAGRGVTVIDPSSDLINRILAHIPREDRDRTILFDTNDPIPIDFFSYNNDRNQRRILTDLLAKTFELEDAPISEPLLGRIISTLFDANENPDIPEDKRATFLDILNFPTKEKRQREIFKYAPHREEEWTPFPKYNVFSSIVGRMSTYTEYPLKNIFDVKRPKLNIKEVIENKQILLVNLHESDTDYFIASLIASKFQQEIFGRDETDRDKRQPYYLYIDECHRVLKYAAEQFEVILTCARKFNLCLTLACPKSSKLPGGMQGDLDLLQSFFLFNMDYKEANIFKSRIGRYQPEYLLSLGKFQAICRTGGKIYQVKTPQPLGFSHASHAPYIKKRTMNLYGLPASDNKVELSQDGNQSPLPARSDEDEPPTLESDTHKPRNP